jgi:hypothetical protein
MKSTPFEFQKSRPMYLFQEIRGSVMLFVCEERLEGGEKAEKLGDREEDDEEEVEQEERSGQGREEEEVATEIMTTGRTTRRTAIERRRKRFRLMRNSRRCKSSSETPISPEGTQDEEGAKTGRN